MARFTSTLAFVVGHVRYKAGTTFADTLANAVAWDIIWNGMSSTTMSPGLIPIDGAATIMKNASVYAGNNFPRPDGVNSIVG